MSEFYSWLKPQQYFYTDRHKGLVCEWMFQVCYSYRPLLSLCSIIKYDLNWQLERSTITISNSVLSTRAPSIYINHICQTFQWTLYINYIYCLYASLFYIFFKYFFMYIFNFYLIFICNFWKKFEFPSITSLKKSTYALCGEWKDVKNRKIQDTSIRSLNPLFHRHNMYDLLNTARTVVIWKVI